MCAGFVDFHCRRTLSAGTASDSSEENHFLRGLQTRAIPAGQGRHRKHLHRTKKIGLYFRGVSHLPLQTIKIDSQNQVFNCNRIELFGFISEITLYENDSNKKVNLFWGATIHESGTKNYSKTVHVLAVRTQFVQWEHKLNAIHSKLNESIQH